ncbi:MAG: hypothetical protein ACXVNM_04845 [Bacteroidia bacterium]
MRTPIVFCFLAAIFFVACKKDRTCTCTVSKNGTSTTTALITASITIPGVPIPLPPITFDTTSTIPVSESQTFDRKMKDVKKKEANYNCVSYTEPYTETTYNIVPSFSLTTISQGTREYKCSLK